MQGTEQHREKYFDNIASLRLPGCFAMTELKHGSNVAGLQTEAVLDKGSDEWEITVRIPAACCDLVLHHLEGPCSFASSHHVVWNCHS